MFHLRYSSNRNSNLALFIAGKFSKMGKKKSDSLASLKVRNQPRQQDGKFAKKDKDDQPATSAETKSRSSTTSSNRLTRKSSQDLKTTLRRTPRLSVDSDKMPVLELAVPAKDVPETSAIEPLPSTSDTHRASLRNTKKTESLTDTVESSDSKGSKKKKAPPKLKAKRSIDVPELEDALRARKTKSEPAEPEKLPKRAPKKVKNLKVDLEGSSRRSNLRKSPRKSEIKDEVSLQEEQEPKMAEEGKKKRGRSKAGDAAPSAEVEGESEKEAVEELTPVNQNLENLQQESGNSNMDSGKENSSDVTTSMSKAKVVRPKKARGQRKERGSKRSLNNVIGILTEGVNIPAESQENVVFTVQTSVDSPAAENRVQGHEEQQPVLVQESAGDDKVEDAEKVPGQSDIILDLSRRKTKGKGSFLEKIVSKIAKQKDVSLTEEVPVPEAVDAEAKVEPEVVEEVQKVEEQVAKSEEQVPNIIEQVEKVDEVPSDLGSSVNVIEEEQKPKEAKRKSTKRPLDGGTSRKNKRKSVLEEIEAEPLDEIKLSDIMSLIDQSPDEKVKPGKRKSLLEEDEANVIVDSANKSRNKSKKLKVLSDVQKPVDVEENEVKESESLEEHRESDIMGNLDVMEKVEQVGDKTCESLEESVVQGSSKKNSSQRKSRNANPKKCKPEEDLLQEQTEPSLEKLQTSPKKSGKKKAKSKSSKESAFLDVPVQNMPEEGSSLDAKMCSMEPALVQEPEENDVVESSCTVPEVAEDTKKSKKRSLKRKSDKVEVPVLEVGENERSVKTKSKTETSELNESLVDGEDEKKTRSVVEVAPEVEPVETVEKVEDVRSEEVVANEDEAKNETSNDETKNEKDNNDKEKQEDFQTSRKKAKGNFAVVHTKSGEILIVEKKKKITKEAAKFFCDICSTSFTRKSSLKKHNSSLSHLHQLSKSAKKPEEVPEQQENSTQDVQVSVSEENQGSQDDTQNATKEQTIVETTEPVDPTSEEAPNPELKCIIPDPLEDELLDEEICKITENMSHDEYVLTDHVSPIAPVAASTPNKKPAKKSRKASAKEDKKKSIKQISPFDVGDVVDGVAEKSEKTLEDPEPVDSNTSLILEPPQVVADDPQPAEPLPEQVNKVKKKSTKKSKKQDPVHEESIEPLEEVKEVEKPNRRSSKKTKNQSSIDEPDLKLAEPLKQVDNELEKQDELPEDQAIFNGSDSVENCNTVDEGQTEPEELPKSAKKSKKSRVSKNELELLSISSFDISDTSRPRRRQCKQNYSEIDYEDFPFEETCSSKRSSRSKSLKEDIKSSDVEPLPEQQQKKKTRKSGKTEMASPKFDAFEDIKTLDCAEVGEGVEDMTKETLEDIRSLNNELSFTSEDKDTETRTNGNNFVDMFENLQAESILEKPSSEEAPNDSVVTEFDSDENSMDTNMSMDIQKIIDDPELSMDSGKQLEEEKPEVEEQKPKKKDGKKKATVGKKKKTKKNTGNDESKDKLKIVKSVFGRVFGDKSEREDEPEKSQVLEEAKAKAPREESPKKRGKVIEDKAENSMPEVNSEPTSRCRQSKKRAEERISRSFIEEDVLITYQFSQTKEKAQVEESKEQPALEEDDGPLDEPSLQDQKSDDESKQEDEFQKLEDFAAVSPPPPTPVLQADPESSDEDDERGGMSPIFAYNTLDSSMESSLSATNDVADVGGPKEDESKRKNSFSSSDGKVTISYATRPEVVTIAPTDAVEDNAVDVPPQEVGKNARQALNFDEELFVECCSRLKATSEKELRGAKKIKLDNHAEVFRKEDPSMIFRSTKNRWKDVESQNSLGSLLESVNQVLSMSPFYRVCFWSVF